MFDFAKGLLPLRVRRQLRKIAAPALRRLRPFVCPACNQGVTAFSKLPQSYHNQMERHGYDYATRKAETCNKDSYSCPSCGASDRDRLYALYLEDALSAASPDFRLLDIAPSKALSTFIRQHSRVNYRTADLYMAGVDDRIDITAMIYPDSSFDACICSHVLEHVEDDKKAISEIYRVLKPGGWAITMVPIEIGLEGVVEDPTVTTEADRWKYFGQGDHVRVYSRQGFLERLTQNGFLVELLKADDFGGEGVFLNHGIAAESVLYISHKEQRQNGAIS